MPTMRPRRQAMLWRLRWPAAGAGAVVHARGIAGGDACRRRERRAELGQRSIVVSRGCSSCSTTIAVALCAGDRHRRRFPRPGARPGHGGAVAGCAGHQRPGLRGRSCSRWRRSRPSPAWNRRRRPLFHQRVDEAPADGGVVDLGCRGKTRSRPCPSRTVRGSCFRRRRRSSGRLRRRESRAPPCRWRPAGAAQAVDGGAGTLSGRPASSADMRATLRLSSPAWLAQP
jgi:hypothetical protein